MTNTELRERLDELNHDYDELLIKHNRLLDENEAKWEDVRRRVLDVELTRLRDENAALVKERDRLRYRLKQIHARLDYEDKSAVPREAILAAQGFCEMEFAADDAMADSKS